MKNPLESLREGGEQWRKHGKLFRAKLLMRDEESGGNTFVLSSNCNIERYYDVAEKVRRIEAELIFVI
jgi:3'-phosphoadenosine 5'-phosphosulfate sulfotransferase